MAYIKFQRGSLAAYEALKNKDPNTLYFIYAKEGATTGSLYLGNALISGGDVILQSSTLNDLTDVIVEGAKTGDFLVKNEEGNWVPKTASEVAVEVLETLKLHKTLTYDSYGALGLAGFDSAENGTYLTKNNSGELVWTKAEIANDYESAISDLQESVENLDNEIKAKVNASDVYTKVETDAKFETIEQVKLKANKSYVDAELTKKANVDNVYTKDEVYTKIEVDSIIANIEHLKRIIVDKLPDIGDVHAIYMVLKGEGENADLYDEYMYIDNKWEKIGNTAISLEGYATESYVTEAIKSKANIGDSYTKTEANILLDAKANVVDIETELNKKIDKIDGYRLIADIEAVKLAGIAENAEVNIVNGVSDDFTIDGNRILTLNNIAISKIVDLADVLNAKAAKADLDTLELRVKDIEDQIGVSLTWAEMTEPTV